MQQIFFPVYSLNPNSRKLTPYHFDNVPEQTSEITKGMLEALKRKVEEIDTGVVSLPEVKEVAALPC